MDCVNACRKRRGRVVSAKDHPTRTACFQAFDEVQSGGKHEACEWSDCRRP